MASRVAAMDTCQKDAHTTKVQLTALLRGLQIALNNRLMRSRQSKTSLIVPDAISGDATAQPTSNRRRLSRRKLKRTWELLGAVWPERN